MKMYNKEGGEGVIEATIVLLLTLSILFALCSIFLNKTLEIAREIQWSDLLGYGEIGRNNRFIDNRTDGDREIREEDVKVEVTIDKFADTEEEEIMERMGIFDGKNAETKYYQR